MWWGGLRGAVGLALAVVVSHTTTDVNGNPISEETIMRRKNIMHLVCTFTIMTLLINAPTTGKVLKKLKLVGQEADGEKLVFRMSKMQLVCEMREYFEQMKKNDDFKELDFSEVKKRIHILGRNELNHVNEEKEAALIQKCSEEEIMMALRRSFFRLLRGQYWQAVDDCCMPKGSWVATELFYSVDVAKDSLDNPMCDWAYIKSHAIEYTQNLADSCEKTLGMCGKSLGSRMKNYMEVDKDVVYLLLTFISAHEKAKQHAIENRRASERVSTMGTAESRKRMSMQGFCHLSNFDALQDKIFEESKREVDEAKDMLNHQDPNLVAFVKQEWAVRSMLDKEVDILEYWMSHWLIDPVHGHRLMHELEEDLNETEKVDNQWTRRYTASTASIEGLPEAVKGVKNEDGEVLSVEDSKKARMKARMSMHITEENKAHDQKRASTVDHVNLKHSDTDVHFHDADNGDHGALHSSAAATSTNKNNLVAPEPEHKDDDSFAISSHASHHEKVLSEDDAAAANGDSGKKAAE